MTTRTFKQFLESGTDDLELMRYELFFRKEMNLTKAAARQAVRWAVKQGQHGAPNVQMIPDDGWERITDWADTIYRKENNGRSLFDRRDAYDARMMVKIIIAQTMREKYGLALMAAPITEDVDELDEFKFELAFRKEFGCTKEQAQELVLWFKDEKDWEDLDHDTRGHIIERFSDMSEDDIHPGMSISDWTMDEISKILKKKYKLDTRDLV